jgi:hypothetical protein
VEIIRFRRCPTLRYFFHIYDDAETLDQDGMELPSIEAAVAMARQDLGQIVADDLMHAGTLNTASRIDIAAEEGQLLASVRFDDLLESQAPNTDVKRMSAIDPKRTFEPSP